MKKRSFTNSIMRSMITICGSIAGARLAGWAFDKVMQR